MNPEWQEFLTREGAVIEDGRVVRFAAAPGDCPDPDARICADLSHLACLRVHGADAQSFLHAQLTADIAALPPGAAVPAAWCNPKGQVIANFVLAVFEDGYLLLLPQTQAGPVAARLRMFVLRARVHIDDVSDTEVCLGCSRDAAPAAALPWPAPDRMRAFLITNPPHAGEIWREWSQTAVAAGSHCWQRLDLRAGLAWIDMPVSAQFLPQELGLDEQGGLSFTKGCFPGQEVIARVHHRGRVRRRPARMQAALPGPPAPGARLYVEDSDAHVATVVNVQADGDAFDLLLCADIELAEGRPIRFGDGAAFPYRPIALPSAAHA